MLKILKKVLALSTALIFVLMLSVNVFASDPVYVKINNVMVDYEDAKPQIINDRAVVPIRQTAETLGATIAWDKTTETMTLTKGERVVVHTMRSKVLTVNGKTFTFDTPSSVVNDRMVMPVRMLSESLGCVVTWDNATRTVNVIADDASIISITPDKTSVNSGEQINIAVVASHTTDKIKIEDVSDSNKLIAESTTYSINSNGTRTFSIPWTPNVASNAFKTLKAVAGNNAGYNEGYGAYKVAAINISADTSPKILSFKADETEVGRGDKVKFTIETNAMTNKVKIMAGDKEVAEAEGYKIKDNDPSVRIFELEVEMYDRGEIELKAYPYKSNEYSDEYKTLKVTVEGAGYEDAKVLSINDAFALNDDVFVDIDTKIIVETSPDIYSVEILDEDERVLANTRFATIKKDNYYVWDFDIELEESGRERLTVVAYDKDDKKVQYNLTLNAFTYNSSDLEVLSIEQRDIGAIVGEDIRFNILTTDKATRVKIMDGSTELASTTSYSNESEGREWSLEPRVTSSNKDDLKVVIYDAAGTQVTKALNVYLGQQDEGEIYDFNLKTPEVSEDEYIRVDVYTNNAIEKVWIEDHNDARVVLKTSYDDVSGSEYTWELKFPAEDKGSSLRYTIYAEDSNGNVYDEYFRVSVN